MLGVFAPHLVDVGNESDLRCPPKLSGEIGTAQPDSLGNFVQRDVSMAVGMNKFQCPLDIFIRILGGEGKVFRDKVRAIDMGKDLRDGCPLRQKVREFSMFFF